MNNRKQQINVLLNSLTVKELDTYLQENKINKDKLTHLETMQRYCEYNNKTTHIQRLTADAYKNIEDLYYIGEAYIIAMVMYYGLHKDFNIKDLIEVFEGMFESNEKLKESVYDIMKDFK